MSLYKELTAVSIYLPPDPGGGGKRFLNYIKKINSIYSLKVNVITTSQVNLKGVNVISNLKYKSNLIYKIFFWTPIVFIQNINLFLFKKRNIYLLISCRDPLCICIGILCILFKNDFCIGTTLYKYDDEESLMKSKFSFIFRMLLKNAKVFILQSPLFLNKKSSLNNCFIIPNGVDFNLVKKYSKNKIKNSTSKNIKLISIGRISERKNTLEILNIFNSLVKKDYPVKLFLLGPYEDDFYYKQCLHFVHKNRLSHNVIFTNYIENPYKYLNDSDIYISASFNEGIPNSILEAMVFGIPVILRKINITTNLLLGEKLNEELSFSNVNEAVSKIEELINSLEYRSLISQKCKSQVKKFEINKIIKKYMSVVMH